MPRGNEAMMSILRSRDFGFVIGDVATLLFSMWKLQFFTNFKSWILHCLGKQQQGQQQLLQQFKKRLYISLGTVVATIVFLSNVTFAW